MRYITAIFITTISGISMVWADPPSVVDLTSKSNSVITATVIPIPIEVFTALDKLGAQNWAGLLEKRDFSPSPDRSRSALLFGLAISQGFVAVQAKNAEEVKRVGMAVQRLAGPLGVEQPVGARVMVIMEALDRKDWEGVKQEFDRTRATVLETMQNMRDDDLASLVALGGWLGGTGALSSMLKENYTEEGSDLLNQSGLLSQLKADFDKLPDGIKGDRIFHKIDETLVKLRNLMTTHKSGTFSFAQVSQIHNETHLLLDAIYEK